MKVVRYLNPKILWLVPPNGNYHDDRSGLRHNFGERDTILWRLAVKSSIRNPDERAWGRRGPFRLFYRIGIDLEMHNRIATSYQLQDKSCSLEDKGVEYSKAHPGLQLQYQMLGFLIMRLSYLILASKGYRRTFHSQEVSNKPQAEPPFFFWCCLPFTVEIPTIMKLFAWYSLL